MDTEKLYREFLGKCSSTFDFVFSNETALQMGESHQFIDDVGTWISLLELEHGINMLKRAAYEYQMSLFALTLGLYHPAFTGLRFFLEHTSVFISHSANLYEYKLWQ